MLKKSSKHWKFCCGLGRFCSKVLPISVPEIEKAVFSFGPHISWYPRMELLFSAAAVNDLVPTPHMATRPRSSEVLLSAPSTLLIPTELFSLWTHQNFRKRSNYDSLRAGVRWGLQENCSKLCTECISHWKCSVCSPAAPVTPFPSPSQQETPGPTRAGELSAPQMQAEPNAALVHTFCTNLTFQTWYFFPQ